MPSVIRLKVLSTTVRDRFIRRSNIQSQAQQACAQRSFMITVGSLKLTIRLVNEWWVVTSGREVGLDWSSSNLLCTTWYQTSFKPWAA